MGAIAALPLALAVPSVPGWICTALLLLLAAFATWVVSLHPGVRAGHDPQEIVIDEFVGFLVASLIGGGTWPQILAALVLFRIFDIAKPWPVGWVDTKLKNAVGVMGDDILAGVLAGIAVRLASELVIKVS